MRCLSTIFSLLALWLSLPRVCHAQSEANLESHVNTLAERRGLRAIYSPSSIPDTTFVFEHGPPDSLAADAERLLRPFSLEATRLNAQLIVTRASPDRTFTVSGFVEDAISKERLVGATVIHAPTGRGVLTNGYGYFSLAGVNADDRLLVSYVGAPVKTIVASASSANLIVRLRPTLELQTVEVRAKLLPLGATLPVEGAPRSPGVLDATELRIGDRDVNTWVGALPGVQSSPGGFRGYGIRGGDPSHNLVMLDDATLYLPSHAAGYLSAIPGDAIRSVELHKNAGPVRYGDRAGSVLDVRLKEGSREGRRTKFSVGAFDIGAATEGPIGKGSYFVTGRRGLTDFWLNFVRPSVQPSESSIPNVDVRFFDITGKINYPLGNRHRLYASFYSGTDKYEDQDEAIETRLNGLNEVFDRSRRFWSNSIASLRHNVALGSKWFVNSTATLSLFDYEAYDYLLVRSDISSSEASFRYDQDDFQSQLRDLGFRQDVQYAWRPDLRLAFGVDATAHRFRVGTTSETREGTADGSLVPDLPNSPENLILPRITTYDASAYAEAEWRPREGSELDLGVRVSSQLGAEKPYVGILPRVRASQRLNPSVSLRTDFGLARQYIHLVSTQNPGLPRDLWVPTTRGLRPLRSMYATLGADVALPDFPLQVSASLYGQRLRGLARFATELDVLPNSEWQDNVELGDGDNYGLELSGVYQRSALRVTAAYTLAYARRRFSDQFGNPLPEERARLDRRHVANTQVALEVSPRWTTSVGFSIGSGLPTRVPRNDPFRQNIPTTNVPLTNSYWIYSGRQVELPIFHSLDLGARYVHSRNGVEYRLSFGAQNIYLRKNPLFLNLRQDQEAAQGQSSLALTQFTLLPILPFVRYAVVF